MTQSWNFKGKTVLVAGAAGGIGQAVARKLAEAGAIVAMADRNQAAGEALRSDLRGGGHTAHFFLNDATNETDVSDLVRKTIAIDGRLDAAINVVGGPGAPSERYRRVHDTDLDAWRETVDLNLTSCFLAMKYQIGAMLEAGSGGAIVNISSLAGLRWSEAAPASYSAAKAGVVRLSQYAAVAYAPQSIRVNVVAPGLTATPAVLNAFADVEKRNALASAQQPIGRMLEPREIADACLWACSDAASGVTGIIIPVDGGWAAK